MNREINIRNQTDILISEKVSMLPVSLDANGRINLASRNARISEINIAMTDSITKKRIIYNLSEPNVFLMQTSLVLRNDRAVLIFTKLKQAVNNISRPMTENI